MNTALNWFLIILSVLVLSGCQRPFSHDYLMRHPDILKQEIERCHAPEPKTREVADRCETVMSAADDFIKILNEQRDDQEKFGMRVMQAEAACVAAKSDPQAESCREVAILMAVIGVNSPE